MRGGVNKRTLELTGVLHHRHTDIRACVESRSELGLERSVAGQEVERDIAGKCHIAPNDEVCVAGGGAATAATTGAPDCSNTEIKLRLFRLPVIASHVKVCRGAAGQTNLNGTATHRHATVHCSKTTKDARFDVDLFAAGDAHTPAFGDEGRRRIILRNIFVQRHSIHDAHNLHRALVGEVGTLL